MMSGSKPRYYILWMLSISGELGGHQGWGNLLSRLVEPAGRMWGNLPGPPHPTALKDIE